MFALIALIGLALQGSHRASATSLTEGTVVPVSAPAAIMPPSPLKSGITANDIVAYAGSRSLGLRSEVAIVVDDREGVVLYGRNIDQQHPIASLTKLMTAVVIADSALPLDELIEVTRADRDTLRGSHSRLPYNSIFTREELLLTALGASDNRAAAALGRTYTGSTPAFVAQMNAMAQKLGMTQTHFADASGLDKRNVSTARDLVKLTTAARQYPLIRTLTTMQSFAIIDKKTNRSLSFYNTNRFVRHSSWEIGLSKTGYTTDAGNCLIMQATIGGRPVTVVLLNSWGKLSKYGDAERIRGWLLQAERRAGRTVTASALRG